MSAEDISYKHSCENLTQFCFFLAVIQLIIGLLNDFIVNFEEDWEHAQINHAH